MTPTDREPWEIEITNRHGKLTIADAELLRAARAVFSEEGVLSAEISLVLTNDAEIHRLNREFLGHDYPTDVISFSLAADDAQTHRALGRPAHLEGELIVSLDTAERVAASQGWSLESEVVFYVVHGLLHLCGYDDQSEVTRPIMRQREREILSVLSLPSGGDPAASGCDETHS